MVRSLNRTFLGGFQRRRRLGAALGGVIAAAVIGCTGSRAGAAATTGSTGQNVAGHGRGISGDGQYITGFSVAAHDACLFNGLAGSETIVGQSVGGETQLNNVTDYSRSFGTSRI